MASCVERVGKFIQPLAEKWRASAGVTSEIVKYTHRYPYLFPALIYLPKQYKILHDYRWIDRGLRRLWEDKSMHLIDERSQTDEKKIAGDIPSCMAPPWIKRLFDEDEFSVSLTRFKNRPYWYLTVATVPGEDVKLSSIGFHYRPGDIHDLRRYVSLEVNSQTSATSAMNDELNQKPIQERISDFRALLDFYYKIVLTSCEI